MIGPQCFINITKFIFIKSLLHNCSYFAIETLKQRELHTSWPSKKRQASAIHIVLQLSSIAQAQCNLNSSSFSNPDLRVSCTPVSRQWQRWISLSREVLLPPKILWNSWMSVKQPGLPQAEWPQPGAARLDLDGRTLGAKGMLFLGTASFKWLTGFLLWTTGSISQIWIVICVRNMYFSYKPSERNAVKVRLLHVVAVIEDSLLSHYPDLS